jgi:hypothetical protein
MGELTGKRSVFVHSADKTSRSGSGAREIERIRQALKGIFQTKTLDPQIVLKDDLWTYFLLLKSIEAPI